MNDFVVENRELVRYVGELDRLKDEREKEARRISISDSDRIFYERTISLIKADFEVKVSELNERSIDAGNILKNIFDFVEEMFSDGNEMLILITELTANYFAVRFISQYGCEEYYRHNNELMFYERQKEIIKAMDKLEWIT